MNLDAFPLNGTVPSSQVSINKDNIVITGSAAKTICGDLTDVVRHDIENKFYTSMVSGDLTGQNATLGNETIKCQYGIETDGLEVVIKL